MKNAVWVVAVVMAIGHMWLTGRLKTERGSVTNVVYEEGWHMIGGPSAQLVKSNQKLSRALGISNVTLPVVREIYNSSTVKPSVVQNRFYAQTGYDGPLRAFCREHGITYQSFWTLTGNPKLLKSKPVHDLAQATAVSVPTALYALVMELGVEVLNGTTSAEHMRDDIDGVQRAREWAVSNAREWSQIARDFALLTEPKF